MAAKMAQQNTKPRSRIWKAKRILAEELERLGASETVKETVVGDGLRTLRRPGIVNVVRQLGQVRNGMELTGGGATSCQTHTNLLLVSPPPEQLEHHVPLQLLIALLVGHQSLIQLHLSSLPPSHSHHGRPLSEQISWSERQP
jgi:hypothetical protein